MAEHRSTASPAEGSSPWVEQVLHFWFDELRPRQWWNAAPETDRLVRERFGALRDALLRDPPPLRDLDGRGFVALVIVLDQFPRNLFRGLADAFATDALARAATFDAIDRGLDEGLDDALKQFLYMPLAHSEDLETQQRSLLLFATLREPDALRAALEHHETIRRFGRFPYRNEALGRPSTDAEREYLAQRARSAKPRRRADAQVPVSENGDA